MVTCARVPVAACTEAEAVDRVLDLCARSQRADVHLCNAYTVAFADRDSAYRELLATAALNLADGHPVAWRLRNAGYPAAERIRGNDLFCSVVDQGRAQELRHYLLGGTDETVVRLREELEARYPGVVIVGTDSPPFRECTDEERAARDRRITESGAQIVWVGLGTPKQDWVAAEVSAATGTVTVGVGAAFDFLSGAKDEAPAWVQDIGFEWVHRLCTEPGRLWKRYLFGNTRFLYATTRYRSTRVAVLTDVIPEPRSATPSVPAVGDAGTR